MRITFVLPGRGGGGGAHSVVQESLGLARLGAEVTIATTAETYSDFSTNYPELNGGPVPVVQFDDMVGLGLAIGRSDLAIATTAPSAAMLQSVLATMGEFRPRSGYYIQDYEPLFFTPGTAEWAAARASYTTFVDPPLLFAKTSWLCDLVIRNHGQPVIKVEPSLDHETYFPRARPDGPVVVSAMLRPRTPRRAPRRTARVLERLAATFGERVRLVAFGCEGATLGQNNIQLSEQIENRGVLSRIEVAELMRASDLFLDLSDYQAFGRTGLEAMACGCIPALPLFGGADEFARHGENAFLIDTRSESAAIDVVREYLGSTPARRAALREAAIETALYYSIGRAALSEYRAFKAFLE